MKFRNILGIILSCMVITGCSVSNNKTSDTVSQNTVTNIEEKQSDKKISVSSVAISHVLDEMGQDVVGRPTTKLDLPEKFKGVPEIGSSFSPDFEKILAVGTNLIIGDSLFKDKIEDQAKRYGIETLYVDTSTYQSFLDGIDQIGEKIGKQDEAEKLVERYKAPIENVDKIDSDMKVAIIFGTSESNMLATEDTYVGSLVKALGVQNVADDIIKEDSTSTSSSSPHVISGNYVNLNLEQLLVNQPDVILVFGHGNIEEVNKSFDKLFNENPAWSKLEAVKNNKVYVLDSNIFGTSANIHMDEALMKLRDIFDAQKE